MTESKLFLLPNFLGDEQSIEEVFPPKLHSVIQTLAGVIVENEKVARRFLLKFLSRERFQELQICILNEHTPRHELFEIARTVAASGQSWGMLSDAGLPCIADPGSDLVLLLKEKQIPIEAVVGPSSILLSLMLSGLPGQRFSFQGYLPQDEGKEHEQLRQMEKISLKEKRTFIWMDTPYRTDKQLDHSIKSLADETYLCVAMNLLLPNQKVITLRIRDWKKQKEVFGKVPSLFLLYAGRDI